MPESTTNTEAPKSLSEAIVRLQEYVNTFVAEHDRISATIDPNTLTPEEDHTYSMQILESWKNVIVSFLSINGFFDHILASHGYGTSGIVNMHELFEALGETAAILNDADAMEAIAEAEAEQNNG